MNVDPQRAGEVFSRALDFETNERAAFLAGACGNDAALRQRVDALLAAHDQQSGFLPDDDTVEEDGDAGGPRSVDALTGQGTDEVRPRPDPHALPVTAVSSSTEGPGTVIGRYKLLEKLGEGGFGSVWAAEQREPVKRRVALKIIKLGMDTRQVVARFEAERQALALMDHPNIAKVLDAGTTSGISNFRSQISKGITGSEISNLKSEIPEGRPFFVMELVKGIPITKYCESERVGTEERLDLFIKVCHAIQHAHQKGIIHRDIKPSNILVTLHDGVPVPKVIDFGIAKATQQELTELTIYTQHHQFIGTPAYMSPEQAEMSGLDIDTRSDIYSLGVLLYELLTGTTPFDTKTLMKSGIDEMRRIIREVEPVRPSTRLSQTQSANSSGNLKSQIANPKSQIDRDLDWIVMKCLEKDRSRRYDTANGLAADLKRHLAHEAVIARPPSAAYRFQKAWRRHRVLFSAGIAVAVVLVAGVVGTSLGLFRAERERSKAEESARQEKAASLEAEAARRVAQASAGELRTNLYFSRVAWAHGEIVLRPPNVKKADNLLRDCPEELRNWEWHHLFRRRFEDPLELRVPGAAVVQSVAWSADGRLLATGSGDGAVRIWDPAVGRLLATLSNHTAYVMSVALNPTNAALVASLGADNHLRLWNWQSATEIRSWPTYSAKDYGMAYSVAFSPDGSRLAAPGPVGEMIVRDVASGEVRLVLPGHQEAVRAVAFDRTGKWIATGSGQGSVNLWEAATGKPIASLGGKASPIGGVAFTHDSARLAAVHFGGTIRTWEVETQRELSFYAIRQAGLATVALAVHPGGDRLISGGLGRLVTISDPATGREVLVLRELTSACYCLAFSPNGNRLAAASRAGSVLLWDATPAKESELDPSFHTLRYPGENASAIEVSPAHRSIAVGGYVGPLSGKRASVNLWNIPSFEATKELPGFLITTFSLAYHPSGRLLAASGDDAPQPGIAKLKVWDLETMQEAYKLESFALDERIFSVLFSHDGKWLLGGGNAKSVRVWDAMTGRAFGTLGAHEKEITKLDLSARGRYLASIGNDDVVKVWDGTRLHEPQTPLRTFTGLCEGFADLIAFSPNEKRLAVVAADDRVVIHDLEGEDRKVELFEPYYRPQAVAFSPDGRRVATGGVDCAVRLWDAETGRLVRTLKSHIDLITRLRFLQRPEGLWLISGSRDGTVKFWEMHDSDSPLSTP